MEKEKYVLHLKEFKMFSNFEFAFIGYWNGKSYWTEDVCFPGVRSDKYEEDVKVYTSRKRAENAVTKLKDKFTLLEYKLRII